MLQAQEVNNGLPTRRWFVYVGMWFALALLLLSLYGRWLIDATPGALRPAWYVFGLFLLLTDFFNIVFFSQFWFFFLCAVGLSVCGLLLYRVRKPEGLLAQIQLQNTSWARYWMQEFFCDLFAVMAAGPAFVWSHFHLCIKRGGDPFDTPLVSVSTHPADDARMRVSLQMLKSMGFEVQATHIEETWQTYIELMGYSPSPEYRQCYPETLLSAIVSAALEGIGGIGVVTAKPDSLQPVVRLLNDAWQEFWRAPDDFQAWEERQMENLRATVNVERGLP